MSIESTKVADLVGARHVGPDVEVGGPVPLEDLESGLISFCTPKAEGRLAGLAVPAGSVIVCERVLDLEGVTMIIAENARRAFGSILEEFFSAAPAPGIHASAVVADSAFVSDQAYVGPHVVIEDDVRVGARTEIEAGAVIGRRTTIGDDCRVGANAVIGSLGYGFEHDDEGRPIRIPHLGAVAIGDRVEIGALASIARGTLTDTRIGDDAKIDDHVFIAHNVVVGERAMIIACAEVSGSVQVGDDAWIAPQATVINKVAIGKGATIGLGAVVIRDVDPDATVVGNPARPLAGR